MCHNQTPLLINVIFSDTGETRILTYRNMRQLQMLTLQQPTSYKSTSQLM